MTRRHDPRRAKRHLSYTREELSVVFDVGLNTISSWVRNGLSPLDDRRPYLFAGTSVQDFLARFNKPRQPTGIGELFCVACKKVIVPAGSVADFIPLGPTNGNLVGVCPGCSHRVCQRVRTVDLERKAGSLQVHYEDGGATLAAGGNVARTEPSEGQNS